MLPKRIGGTNIDYNVMSDASGYAVCDFCGHEMFMPCRSQEDSTACRSPTTEQAVIDGTLEAGDYGSWFQEEK